MTINRGDRVAYLLVPGWTGIVTAVTEELRGAGMAQIEHFVDEAGGVHDGLMADLEYFEVLKANAIPAADLVECDHVPLGALVKDVVSGFKGTVTRKIYWLNGCVNVAIVADDKKELRARECAIQYVQVLREDHYQLLFPDKGDEPKGKGTGGPNLPRSGRGY